MKRITVLGAGMVGAVIAQDLAEDDLRVTLVDRDEARLAAVAARSRRPLETRVADCGDPHQIREAIAAADVVAGALPSHLGFRALETVIACSKPYCDISFMPEDAWSLDAAARAQGIPCVVDCGVAPGMSNLFAGLAAARFERLESLDIYVGGLPRERRWPFEYKAAFSPADVLEEYVRPARVVEGGKVCVREALSEPELLDLPGVGTVEAFNTDGLRSLVQLLGATRMREKTLRYPGHRALMAAFRATGLFGTDPIQVGGVSVRPRDVLAALMFPHWRYEEGEEDLTVMRIVARGLRAGQSSALCWDLLDRYDPTTGRTSMARTTAFPCAIVTRLIAAGRVNEPGVYAPERLGIDEALVALLLRELEARGVVYSEREL